MKGLISKKNAFGKSSLERQPSSSILPLASGKKSRAELTLKAFSNKRVCTGPACGGKLERVSVVCGITGLGRGVNLGNILFVVTSAGVAILRGGI